LHSLRRARDFVQSLQRRMEYQRTLRWTAEQQQYAHEVCGSPVFDRKQVERLLSENRLHRRSLYKMHTLAKFFDFYVQNREPSLPML
jgi:hypothetical protein